MTALLQRLAVAFAGAVLAAAPLAASAQSPDCHGAPSPTRVFVSAEGVRNARGLIVASVFGPDRSRFLSKTGALFVWRDPARPGETVQCFYLPAPGDFAVVVFHDANANGKLDLGLFGIPIEGYGFSNNFRAVLHAPSFEEVKFTAVPGDTRLRIRLRYP